MKPSKSAGQLASRIQKAIDDHRVTEAEWDSIMALAEKDHHIDREEAALLRELHHLIENGTVKRVP
jgi:hypothetical protein